MVTIAFKSYKGLGLPYSRNISTGKRLEYTWLASEYNQPSIDAMLDSAADIGARTLSIWLHLPAMLANRERIGLATFKPAWNPAFVANFDALLDAVLQRGQELIVTLFNLSPTTTPQTVETAALLNADSRAGVNWRKVVFAWCSRYSRNTPRGNAVAAWVALKEGGPQYAAWNLKAYRTIRCISGHQPVGVDVWTNPPFGPPRVQLDAAAPACDFLKLHHYQDVPIAIPDLTPWGKPWIMGEFGPDYRPLPTYSHLMDATWSVPSAREIYAAARVAGALHAASWAWVFKMHTTWAGGQTILGPVGQLLQTLDTSDERRESSAQPARPPTLDPHP